MHRPSAVITSTNVGAIPTWWNNSLTGLHFSNTIWGNTIQTREWMAEPGIKGQDAVLYSLMHIGIEDWSGENKRTWPIAESMQLVVSMTARLAKRVFALEDWVSGLVLHIVNRFRLLVRPRMIRRRWREPRF